MDMVNTSLSRSNTGLGAFGLMAETWSMLGGWTSVARQRAALARLDDHLLADIGVSRDAAEAEAVRPFWDISGN